MKQPAHTPVRKPLYAAIAVATLSLGSYFGSPGVAFAAQPQAPAPAASASATPSPTQVDTGTRKKKKKGEASPIKLNTVMVTGFRQSVRENLEQKRQSNAVVEVINAQNISQFPAKNIADALQRVPGVIISRSSGQGKTVSIRGLAPELTLTELNGNYVASADTSAGLTRSFNYLLLPADMFASVKLYKSQEARLDEGGIGGVVELHTRRPLEMPANKGFVSINATGMDNNNKTDPQVSALYSWHNKDDTFGVLIGGVYQKREQTDYSSNATSWHWWANDYTAQPPVTVGGTPFSNSEESNIDLWPGGGVTDQAGNSYSGYFMPQQFSTSRTYLNLRNQGEQATFQFKPTDDFLLTANYFQFKLKRYQVTNVLEIPEWNLPTGSYADQQGNLLAPNGLTFDPSHTIVTGANYVLPPPGQGCNSLTNPVTGAQRQPVDVCSTQTPWVTGSYSKETATSHSANIKGEWSTSGMLSGSFNVGRSWATGGPSVEFGAAAKPRNFSNGQWQDGSQISQWTLTGKPTMTVSPNVLQNMLAGVGQMDLGSTGSGFINTDTSQNFAQADFTLDFDSGWLESLQFGVKYRDTHAHQQGGELKWYCPGTTEQFQSCDPNAGDLHASFLEPTPLNGHTRAYSDNLFPAFNFPAYYHYLNSTYDAQRILQPDDQASIRESISAAYVQANYNTGNLRGNVGIRFVSTLQNVATADKITKYHAVYYHAPDGSILICPNSGVNAAGGACAPGDFEYRPRSEQYTETYAIDSQSKRYNNVLPSFNVVYSLPDNVVLRVTGSKAMARANYDDLAQLGSLSYFSQAYYNDRKQFGSPLPGWYGSGANKDLKPFTATQFDLGAAWYYAPDSVVGMNLFHKSVKNFVVPVTVTNKTVDVNGTQQPFMQYSTEANGRKGISKGVEVFTQHTFPMGFGVIANYTLNKTNETAVSIGSTQIGKSALIGSARYAGNVSLFYEKHHLLLRASSNWTGRVVNGLVAGLPEYTAPYNEIDLNGHYEFTRHLMLTASVLNLTQSTERSYLGSDTTLRLSSLSYSGRRYYMGLTYKFGPGG